MCHGDTPLSGHKGGVILCTQCPFTDCWWPKDECAISRANWNALGWGSQTILNDSIEESTDRNMEIKNFE